MNTFTILCLIALAATIQISQTIQNTNDNIENDTSSDDNSVHFFPNGDPTDNQHDEAIFMRDLRDTVDGIHLNSMAAGVYYQQRLHNGQCVVDYKGQYLHENSVIQIRKKLYRVEHCLLERVFHSCGPNLLLMVDVVCRVIERSRTTTTTVATTTTTTMATAINQVPASDARLPVFFRRIYPQSNRRPRSNQISRMITESCCEGLCSLSELTRYCRR